MRVFCFGSMNLDYVYSLDHIAAPGETIFADRREVFVGGKGLNQSIAMAKAGLPVFHAGICGAAGEPLMQALQENGVDVSLVAHSDHLPGHTVIQVDARGQNSIILYGGTNREITTDYIDRVLAHTQPGDVLLLQNEINLLDMVIDKAYEKGLSIVLNPSPYDGAIGQCALNKVRLFLVNEIEGAQISGQPAAEPENILNWFVARYPAAEVILTLGAHGAWYAHGIERIFQSAIPVKAMDTTAAGDTFTGYFLEGWIHNRGVAVSLYRAAKAASIAVTRKGAAPSIPLAAEVE